MADDDLEVIELTPEDGYGAERTRSPARLSRGQSAALAAFLALGALGAGLLLHHSSGHAAKSSGATVAPTVAVTNPASDPNATLPPPSAITGIVAGNVVEIVNGSPILVGQNGETLPLLTDLPGLALVDATQQGSVLIGYRNSTTRVIVGPTFDATRNPLPAAFTLFPDAGGRWWSNFGLVEGPGVAHALRTPTGTEPVAKLLDGYLLVDDAHTQLLRWRPGTAPATIAAGNLRVLAVASNLVAWSDDAGDAVSVTNLATGQTFDIQSDGYAVTARFSPDRSRLAILTSGSTENMVLADPVTGLVITRVETALGGRGLDVFPDVPPAFEPAPFGWDRAGTLLVLTESSSARLVQTLEPRRGAPILTVAAPDGLEQAIPLLP